MHAESISNGFAFYLWQNIKFVKSQINMVRRKKKLPPMVWQNWVGKTKSVDQRLFFHAKIFFAHTERMNPWSKRTYLPHTRLDEDRLPDSRCWYPAICKTERSQPPSFHGKKTAAAGEPRAGKENTRGLCDAKRNIQLAYMPNLARNLPS